jgi:hypothetical protein
LGREDFRCEGFCAGCNCRDLGREAFDCGAGCGWAGAIIAPLRITEG